MYHTRIAPSPTGMFHLGTARTALFNYLTAKATGGTFLCRIDDTHLERNNEAYVQVVFDALEWLGLKPDNVIRQSDRLERYSQVALDLMNIDRAKYLDNGAIVLRTDKLRDHFYDEVHRDIPISSDDHDHILGIKHQGIVLLRSPENGVRMPTYHFACVVDDVDFGINHIIRGVDHITNTSRQIAIYDAWEKNLPKFSHIGLIYHNKKKLSKRDNPASLSYYKDELGIIPEAMINFLARQGWGPKIDDRSTAVLTMDQLLKLFVDGGSMRHAPSNIDLDILNSYNKKHKKLKLQTSVQ